MAVAPSGLFVCRPDRLVLEGLAERLLALGLPEIPYAGSPPSPGTGAVYLVDASGLADVAAVIGPGGADGAPAPNAAIVLLGGPGDGPSGAAAGLAVSTFQLPASAGAEAVASLLAAAAEVVTARRRAGAVTSRLHESEERIAVLNRIGIALSAERDLEKLLERILTEARRFSRSEAGSLYLLEDGPDGQRLRFKLAQNDAVRFAFTERTMAVDDRSIAGYVANHGVPLVLDDAYEVPEEAPYRHNDAFDLATGWRTRAMLGVPMKDHRGDMVGVLQLMNRKSEVPGEFEPYPADMVPLLLSLATQAAVCLKANQLTQSIRRLFEDFARAAIIAVEQRDPTTAGHSNRVAELTAELARIVDRADEGPYSAQRFSREELREIETAALLHDFGKISVPERVLLKQAKLEAEAMQRLRDRFDFILESGDSADYRSLLHRLLKAGVAPSREDLEVLESVRVERTRELEAYWEEIRRCNEPTVLPKESGEKLKMLLARSWRDRRGVTMPLLHDDEFRLLSIPKGSLSSEERIQIESHVSHTWRFLSSIPWTQDLARVPEIAYAHHEKLNGIGYPRRLKEESIPVPSRILTVCDIYDALTASDRPYKKAVPRERALKILEDEARDGLLDVWLVQTFISQKVWVPVGAS